MRFQLIEPHPRLKKHIEKIWLFESDGKMPAGDIKLVVPNGNLKLTISYQNGVVAAMNGKTFTSDERDITLTGLVDVPVVLDADKDVATKTIGIEFRPQSVYRFFPIRLHDIQNQICSLSDVLGNTGKRLVAQVDSAASVSGKIGIVQAFLLKQLAAQEEDLIFGYCIDRIIASSGSISVQQLEKSTGYSSRWLNMKFGERLGASPKNFSTIIRFSQYYHSLVNRGEEAYSRKDFYEHYYDQSHFIKDFRRFTGLTPARFEKHSNDFGERYYRG